MRGGIQVSRSSGVQVFRNVLALKVVGSLGRWVVGLMLVIVVGCGGGGGAETGRAVLTIVWPSRGRLIPAAANSITVSFSRSGNVLASQTVARPDNGTESIVSFANLHPGDLAVTASAYPSYDGTGVAQASGSSALTIQSGKTAAITLTMASTIDHLEVSPSPVSLIVGQHQQLSAVGRDAAGALVLLSPGKLTWSADPSGNAAVSLVGIVSTVSPGYATVTVTDTESGKSGSVNVTIMPFDSSHFIVSVEDIVSSQDAIYEVTPSGAIVQTIPVPWPAGGARTQHIRSAVVDHYGGVQVINSIYPAYLSTYNVASRTWHHTTIGGWVLQSPPYVGAVGVMGDYIFLPNNATLPERPDGVIGVNVTNYSTVRFPVTGFSDGYDTVTAGQDGMIYAANTIDKGALKIDQFDPNSHQLVRSIPTPTYVRGLAVNQSGEIHCTNCQTNSHLTYRLAPDGSIITAAATPQAGLWTISLTQDGYVLFGAYGADFGGDHPGFCRANGVLTSFSQFSLGTSSSLNVTFAATAAMAK